MSEEKLKEKILLLILLLLTTQSFASVEEIIGFSNGSMFIEHDMHSGAVLKYDNRLIVRSLYKITEYEILKNGGLSKVSFYETKNGAIGNSLIDGDRYYYFYANGYIYGSPYHVVVYDLSQTPMKKITTFNTNISFQYGPSIYFTENHLMITDFTNRRVVYINKNTFDIDGYINESEEVLYAGVSVVKSNYLIHGVSYTDGSSFIRFYDMIDIYNNELDLISEVKIFELADNASIISLRIQDNFLIVSHHRGVVIMDFQDIKYPKIIHNLKTDGAVCDAFYSEDNIIVVYYSNLLEVFHCDSNENYQVIHQKMSYSLNHPSNLLLSNDYLYWNNGFGLNVYDILDDFSQVNIFGRLDISDTYFPNDNDIYYFENQQTSFTFDIYSILDGKLMAHIDFNQKTYIVNLQIKNNILYLITAIRIDDTWQYFFEIYKIENEQTQRLSTMSFDGVMGGVFCVGDNRVFINFSNLNLINVYNIDAEYNLEYIGQFSGMLQTSLANFPKEYILSHNANNVTLREQSNFEKIVASINISMTDRSLWYYGNGYFFANNLLTGRYSLYNYSPEKSAISLHYNFPQSLESYILPFNEIITKNATYPDKSIYYTIINGQIKQIGEKLDERCVKKTYFYPERRKMVQIAGSGIWVYDFDYVVTEQDVVAEPDFTGLAGNYPNPFNPMTTISFSLSNNNHVSIDIYNIKGQKVHSLVNGVYSPGKHSAVWNGHDDNGVSVGSGVYFYRMTTGEYSETKKMILMK